MRPQETRVFQANGRKRCPDHFLPEDLPRCSCRAVVLERRVGEELAVMVAAGKVPTQWLGVYGCAAKTMVALSAKLRLGPLTAIGGRRPSRACRRATTIRRPHSVAVMMRPKLSASPLCVPVEIWRCLIPERHCLRRSRGRRGR